ncbi:60 kDa inner membrane insertion protein [Kribbella flavida DSM 17836]|uniref:Membrane protein insertase YidC n=1 Tax=Kribbella flavida (strain DSM 17836 / JCM 10339 / NBRC 14399) TaxID=479435 RepID=D2Q560_KRIFD|nr:membrane protein insertase YidC [Kribbella flavida]ADB36071.1 60 kDa inner membrane insertion protein [Kribbella flavida DSM 17836]
MTTLLAIPQLALWDGIVDVFNAVMTPLYWAVSALLVGWHWLLSQVLDPNGGWAWALSIAGLTIVIRTLLIPLFVRQIRSSRNMQLLQPKMKELQKKYGHDREKLGQEMMKLYKETGTNPFSSCLPLLLQSPVFLALFRVLDGASKGEAHSSIIAPHVNSLRHAKIFGAEISQTFLRANGDGSTNVKIVAIVLIILMTATMFITQLQLMRKNMPKEALEGQAAQMQKIMLYVFPIFFLIGGFNFPIGVLIYWFVSNVWTMGQQFYVIRRNPAPGTPAFDAMEARKREHNRRAGQPEETGLAGADTDGESGTDRRPVTRQQPKRQSRSDRRSGGTTTPAAGARPQDEVEPKASANGQQPAAAKKAPAAKKAQAGGKRQPAAKSRAQRTAQQKAAQQKSGQKKSGGSTAARKTDS